MTSSYRKLPRNLGRGPKPQLTVASFGKEWEVSFDNRLPSHVVRRLACFPSSGWLKHFTTGHNDTGMFIYHRSKGRISEPQLSQPVMRAD